MEEIDLKKFAKLAWAKKIYIVVIMIVAILVGYFYSYMYIIPRYQSTTTLLVAKISEDLANENTVKQSDIADFSMTSTLLEPYISIIESKTVLTQVISNLDLKMSEEELKNTLTVKEENTAMLSIAVSNEDAELAKEITNEIAKVFIEESKEMLNIANVNIVDYAEVEDVPYNINHLKDLLIFGMLGVFLSIGLVFVTYMLDTTIKEEEDIENEIGLPILGTIPIYEKKLEKNIKDKEHSSKKKDSEIVILGNAKSPVAEAFRALRTNVTFAQNTKTILVTSSRMSEGKSYVTANLAATIAKTDKKVIIVDADMRKGRQNKIFGVDNKNGLSNYLADCEETKVDISELASYIKTTKVPNLHLITSGSRPSNPAELLSPPKVKGLFSVLSEIYDIVIIDGTPSSIIADSVGMSRFVDFVMLVTAYKSTKTEDVKRLIKSFEQVGVKLSGAVLNKYPLTKEGYNSSYYYNDSKSDSKLEENKQTEIRTVENFLRDANINMHSFRYIDDKTLVNDNSFANSVKSKNFEVSLNSNAMFSNVNNALTGVEHSNLEYKVEKIDSEIAVLKNMIMQIAMNTNQVTTKDIELIRYDINNLKEHVDDMKDAYDVKPFKEELKEIREATDALMNSQAENNEKIKKFIENYNKQKAEYINNSNSSEEKKTYINEIEREQEIKEEKKEEA